MTICNGPHNHMIKIDGSLWHGSATLIPELEKQGWRVVVNPKRSYYAEYDKTSNSYRDETIVDVNEDTDMLDVELL